MKNKKTLVIVAAVVVVLAVVLAVVFLGGNETPTPTPATEKEYKLGMGVVVSTSSSKTGNAQVDATVATVVLDAEGKIVACRLDVAQNKYAFNEDEEEIVFSVLETKMELQDRYNMRPASPIRS